MKCIKCGKRKAKTKECKFCARERSKRWKQSLRGRLHQCYHDLVKRSKLRVWPMPNFDIDRFTEHFANDESYVSLWKEWEGSGFKHALSPSVDRINPTIPYVWDNIRMITWSENHAKGMHEDRVQGTVEQQDPDWF